MASPRGAIVIAPVFTQPFSASLNLDRIPIRTQNKCHDTADYNDFRTTIPETEL
jgi:hypothetical protein